MMAHDNWEVVPRAHQEVSTMDSHLKYFTRMNPLTFYKSKVDEDTIEFIDEVYKIIFSMGFSTCEKDKLATYQIKDVSQTWYVQWRDQ